MNTELFNYICDAMDDTLKLMVNEIGCAKHRKAYEKLKNANKLFYDWYQTAWEYPQKAIKIKPENKGA